METSKGVITVLKHSDDIFKDILSPMSERGTSPYVYFYRIIGCNDEPQYLAEIVHLDHKLRLLDNYICFDKSIHMTPNTTLIEQARKLFEQVPLKDFSNGALLNVLETRSYFSVTSNIEIDRKIKKSFGIMLNLYMNNERPINLSITVNFITKILLWLRDYGKQIGGKSLYNPKIIYWGSPKAHEIYFLILLSFIGCDILVLNMSFKDRFEEVDKLNEFSFSINKANERQINDFPTKDSLNLPPNKIEESSQPSVQASPKLEKNTERDLSTSQSSIGLNDPAIVVKLKKSENIIEEILVPMTQRSGYVGGPFPILPTYFMRYIGVPGSSDDWEAEYYNSLYNLDNAFETSGHYLKFMEGVPAPNAAESDHIPQSLIGYHYKDRGEIIKQMLQAKILPQMYDQLLDNTITKTLVDSVILFHENNSNLNPSIVLNFSLKLVIWFNRYLPNLLRISHGDKKISVGGPDYENNPKILFYGTIKPHEIYLLHAFHKTVSYTHLRAHETRHDLVCRL